MKETGPNAVVQPIGHPSPIKLAAFAQGRLSGDEFSRIEQHVADCAPCCESLREVPDDTLMQRLREQDTPVEGTVSMDRPPDALATDKASGDDEASVDGDAVPAELVDHPRYEVLRKLGAGGMGDVFLARHRLMERSVALKVINPSLINRPQAVERFRQEVKNAARLSHRNIVTAHDAEQAGDTHFLVMEFIPGASLDRVVARYGKLPVEFACNYIRQVALGLKHAHQRGMIHRDIKPQNLMLAANPKGVVKILDFGLSRLAEQAGDRKKPLTSRGVMLGTPDFVAPEQAVDSRKAGKQADIYALGCTLYFLLAARTPFPEGSALEKVSLHINHEPTPLQELREDLPLELILVVNRMMAKDPKQRMQSAAEVAEALAPFAQGSAKTDLPAAAPQPVSLLDDLPDEIAAPSQPSTRTLMLPSRWGRSSSWKQLRRTPWLKPLLIAAGGLAALIVVALAIRVLIPDSSTSARERTTTPGSAPPQPPKRAAPQPSQPATPQPEKRVAPRAPTIATEKTRPSVSSRETPLEPPRPVSAPSTPIASSFRSRVLIVAPHRNPWRPDYDNVAAALTSKLGPGAFDVTSSRNDPITPDEGAPIAVTVSWKLAQQRDYGAVIFIGKNPPSEIEFIIDPTLLADVKGLCQATKARGGLVTAICGGAAVLLKAGELSGVEAARCPYVSVDAYKAGGAQLAAVPVVAPPDRSIITAGRDQDAEAFVAVVLRRMRKK